jgi:hypothetical protein
MSNTIKDRIERLNALNAKVKKKNKDKILRALDSMMRRSEPVNIAKIALEAGVSRQTIYRDEEVRQIIDNFRETSILRKNRKVIFEKEQRREASSKAKLEVVIRRLKKIEAENIQLKQENQKLKEYIEKSEF